MGVMRNVL